MLFHSTMKIYFPIKKWYSYSSSMIFNRKNLESKERNIYYTLFEIFLFSFRENPTIRSTAIDCRRHDGRAARGVSRAYEQREKNERKILVVIGSVTKVASHKSRPRVEKRLVTDVTWSRCEISYKRNQGQPFPFRIVIRIDLGRCYIFRHETFERIYHDRRLYKRDREIFFEMSKKCL